MRARRPHRIAVCNPWRRVVFAADCDPDTDECPVCGIDYALCDCPGPTMGDYEYSERGGVLYGRKARGLGS
ncbi:hypothetical protein [Bradyrhizobium elkanii]|uniref:hypothetical protein n=1 Tax=Bradyrhizobium elkanii TaxID=29448 RepID=UPI0004B362D7|nr:hypothetical protein [Bradyrhizobium elkanii]WLA79592.1 hypothetical protein QNJ99_29875 [Bradyrhizobium elkanii]